MELFGYLTFVGDVQTLTSQNAQYGNEPFVVREVCVHTFVPSVANGETVPYLRGLALRLTGRMAQNFNLTPGSMVCVECGSTCRPYRDRNDQKMRVNGSLTVSRICLVLQSDVDAVARVMQSFQQI